MTAAVVLLIFTCALALVLLKAWPSSNWLAVRVATAACICLAGTAFAIIGYFRSSDPASSGQATRTVTASPSAEQTRYVTVTVTPAPNTGPSNGVAKPPPPRKPPPIPLQTYYLFDMQHMQVEGCCNWSPKAVNINGMLYAKSVGGDLRGVADAQGDALSAQYDLGRACKRLMFTIGVTDDSNSGTVSRFDVQVDGGTAKFSKQVRFGHSIAGSVDVTKALRLKLSIISLTQDAHATAFGDARLSCSRSVLPKG